MPLASLVHDRLQTLIARGGEQVDLSALGQLAANDGVFEHTSAQESTL
jgi:hypothetical protein